MIQSFLTAYDPSDLPGGSVDPLGFEQGYLFLANKILPGMTVVASCPRYLSLLCAGATLAADLQGYPEKDQHARRQEVILRLERLWALANVLASNEDDTHLAGLRGITYAKRHSKWLEEHSRTKTSGDFKLLSRQTAYGVLGIYGNIAEQSKLIYRRTLEPIPSMGEPLGGAFRKETEMPTSVKKASLDDREEVGLGELRSWGERARLWGKTYSNEKRYLKEALLFNAVRTQFCELLHTLPTKNGEAEQARIQRIAKFTQGKADYTHLWEPLEAILHYETCYRACSLVFQRILYLCRNSQAGYITSNDILTDEGIEAGRVSLALGVKNWIGHIDKTSSAHFRSDWQQLLSAHDFLKCVAERGRDNPKLVALVMARHSDVQRGKFDHGRRKMAWLQQVDNRISLAPTRIGGLDGEVTKPDNMEPHIYRLNAADNWMTAAGFL